METTYEDNDRDAAPQPVTPDRLNVLLCEAMGVDPNTSVGFRLTVMGGSLPNLEVYASAPDDGRTLLDSWARPLAQARATAQYVLLPGSDPDAPPVQHPAPAAPPFLMSDPGVAEAETLRVTLLKMADVLNGAGCDMATRDQLTSAARELAQELEGRVIRGVAGHIAASTPDADVPLDRERADAVTAALPPRDG
jgi:hypothetical protein